MANSMIEKLPKEMVLQQLHELFGSILSLDVIKTVALSCEYDVNKSSNKLLELTTTRRVNVNQGQPVAAKKSRKAMDIQKAVTNIEKGYKVLVIVRGLPGSGKSYLAKQILATTVGSDVNINNHILSTDAYFCRNPRGVYNYDPRFIEEAHNWNQHRAFESMSRGYSPVIIDNTNTQMWEMKPYVTMATDYGYLIEILEPDTHWCFNDKELTKRNQHGVPKTKICDMLGRYEKNVTPQKLLSAYNLSYKLQKPPQLRLYPPPNARANKLTNNVVSTKISPVHTKYSDMTTAYSFLQNNQIDRNEKIADTIDLMDFNDDGFSNQSDGAANCTARSISNSTNVSQHSSMYSVYDGFSNAEGNNRHSVDEILMCSNDSHTTPSTNILLPQMNNANNDVISIDSSDEELSSKADKSKVVDIESSWGVNEDIMKTWDIVTPLDETGSARLPVQAEAAPKPETKDASSIVEEDCFKLLENREAGVQYLRILNPVSRDINRYTTVSTKNEPIPKKIMLAKSCMTDDVFEDYENHMSKLMSLFPSMPKEHLHHWYNKCKGDLEWTIEFLLEARGDELNALFDEDNENKSNGSESREVEDTNPGPSGSAVKPSKKFRKSADLGNELKRLIESKIDINDKYYSKHVLKVKNYKFKNQTDAEAVTNNFECNSNSSSSSLNKEMEEDDVIVMEESDVEFDDAGSSDDEKSEASTEETIELNLGDHFVTQLENEFGDSAIEYPKGFQPVVQVPKSLARQLYAFYMESVYQQMENQRAILETLTKEDEEFAKKLQAKEDEENAGVQEPPTVNFKEIMDEQAAQSIYEKEASTWKNLDPDSLAAKLTRLKLFSAFPNIDQGTLVEILHAHGNKYADTIESLLASTGQTSERNIEQLKEPPIQDDVLEEMREAKKNSVIEEYTKRREATFYREEANRFLKKRSDLYQQAQVYHLRGMNEVAQFYSTLASRQTEYYERANSFAATAFLDEHSNRLKDFNTLDLHFLYVKEALPALDVFLDRNINLLKHSKTKQSECLQIITGRGKNSENGIAKIRPAVQARLHKRGIRFQQLNPGLLKIKITKNSKVTSELST